jgi:hypothetical protein
MLQDLAINRRRLRHKVIIAARIGATWARLSAIERVPEG